MIDPAAQLTESELFSLILEPGFSTAREVTNVSGRGVGMDVVRRSVDALRGTIEISSTPGAGMTVTLRLVNPQDGTEAGRFMETGEGATLGSVVTALRRQLSARASRVAPVAVAAW